jgi:hypothetical protein
LPTLALAQANQHVLWVPVQFGLPIDWYRNAAIKSTPDPQMPPRLRAISACAISGEISQA